MMAEMKLPKSFLKREEGTVTVELVVWMPFLVMFIGLIFDLSMILTNHADMWNVASDTSRQLALGQITSSDATQYANDNSFRGAGYSVNVTTAGTRITTEISIPWNEVSVTSWFRDASATISVFVSQRVEPTT